MAILTLKNFPDDLHREVKRLQLDYEDKGIKKSLEQIYVELVKTGLASEQK
ncbi:MAG: hypothetical protein JXR07_19960 [Reichenbachiella sp.]